ncbi:MAG TPA: hypothetical protein VIN04_05735, partial [Myxococcota bacterium]
PAVAIAGAISLWQLEEPVYRRSTEGVIGSRNLSPLWYPLTLGLLGVLALAGARRMLGERGAFRFELLGWVVAVVLLHGLPFLNGYKFVFLLPLPLCVLAAPVARELFGGPRLRALVAGIALFGGVALQTLEAWGDGKTSVLSAHAMELIDALALRPAGNALVPPVIGAALPAYTPHRVWIGHWFLTPDVEERQRTLTRLMADPAAAAAELRALCREQRLRYLAVFEPEREPVARALDGMIEERLSFGTIELFVLEADVPERAGSASR